MTGILLTQSTTPIIGQVAWLLGKLMDGIFNVLSSAFGIENIGLCIILFTIIIYTFMIPLTIKQQKFSKLSAVMNPELQAIQKKYKNKRDQESMLKMQEEMKMVYDKYGTSQMGGCLQLVIDLQPLFQPSHDRIGNHCDYPPNHEWHKIPHQLKSYHHKHDCSNQTDQKTCRHFPVRSSVFHMLHLFFMNQ